MSTQRVSDKILKSIQLSYPRYIDICEYAELPYELGGEKNLIIYLKSNIAKSTALKLMKKLNKECNKYGKLFVVYNNIYLRLHGNMITLGWLDFSGKHTINNDFIFNYMLSNSGR